MASKPVVMWAPIVQGRRGEWIYHYAICATRRQAKAVYLEGYEPAYHRKLLKGVRFARVTVSELRDCEVSQ